MRAGKSGNERFSLDVDAGNNTEATRFLKSRVDCSPCVRGHRNEILSRLADFGY